MNITMIGISGSGKTSYMSGLYETFGADLFNDFRIEPTPKNRELVDQYLLAGDFEAISFSGNEYRFPIGTTKTTLWQFDLLRIQSLVTTFHWIDYRGGLLTESSSKLRDDESMKEELEQVAEHIVLSDAIIIFVDSVILSYYDDIKLIRSKSGINKITNLLMQFDKQFPNKPLTYLIALTKADAVCKPEFQDNNYQKLVNTGLEAFNVFIEYAKLKPNWVGGIAPISAVGDGNASIEYIRPENLQKNIKLESELIKSPQPMNIGESLFFVMGGVLRLNAREQEMKYNELQKRKKEILAKSNIVYRIWQYITQQESPESIITTIEQQQEVFRNNLNMITPYIEPILSIARKKITPILPHSQNTLGIQ